MQINSEFEFLIKVVVIGDSGVGKTNIIFQYTEGKFSSVHVATVGFDYKSKIIKLPNSKKKVKMQIWDTAGQERYMAINKNLFQRVQGIILMYDLTNRESFEHISNWLNMIKQTVPNKPLILVANKLDIADEKRIVTENEGEKIAKENNIEFFEASGSTGENVDKLFEAIGESVFKYLMEEKGDYMNNNIKVTETSNKKKKCCS